MDRHLWFKERRCKEITIVNQFGHLKSIEFRAAYSSDLTSYFILLKIIIRRFLLHSSWSQDNARSIILLDVLVNRIKEA